MITLKYKAFVKEFNNRKAYIYVDSTYTNFAGDTVYGIRVFSPEISEEPSMVVAAIDLLKEELDTLLSQFNSIPSTEAVEVWKRNKEFKFIGIDKVLNVVGIELLKNK